jgi:hypothetical protein
MSSSGAQKAVEGCRACLLCPGISDVNLFAMSEQKLAFPMIGRLITGGRLFSMQQHLCQKTVRSRYVAFG